MPSEWQIRFDGGRQQRYLPDRESVLLYVLGIGARTPEPRFEVFSESEPVRLADGSSGGRRFTLAEVLDLREPGVRDRLVAELARTRHGEEAS